VDLPNDGGVGGIFETVIMATRDLTLDPHANATFSASGLPIWNTSEQLDSRWILGLENPTV
jgi:hypothetical protein